MKRTTRQRLGWLCMTPGALVVVGVFAWTLWSNPAVLLSVVVIALFMTGMVLLLETK